MGASVKTPNMKINPQLAARIAQMDPSEIIRVVVLMSVPRAATGHRLSPVERSREMARVRAVTSRLLRELRPTLDLVGAKQQVAPEMGVLGSIVIDVPAANVSALAAAEQVKSILADQQLTLPDER